MEAHFWRKEMWPPQSAELLYLQRITGERPGNITAQHGVTEVIAEA